MIVNYIKGTDKIIELSILVCTLYERREKFLLRLLSILEPQIENKPVEIVILTDNSEIPIGTKRNLAIDSSNGNYICFVDDDDLVSGNYVDLILEKMKDNPDVISISGFVTTNGENRKEVKQGIEFVHSEKDGVYYRLPNHLSVHKKSNIIARFLDVRTGEDDEWASRRLAEIKTQCKIEFPVYHYDFRTDTKKYFVDETDETLINGLPEIFKVEITKPSGTNNLEGSILVQINGSEKNESILNFPLHLSIVDIFGRAVWSSDFVSDWFSSFFWIPWTKAKLIDSCGNLIWTWTWNPLDHGCICHQIFHLWSIKNRGAFGIAIGTHDGSSGEWVGPVNDGVLKALLIEGSPKNFEKLKEFYQNKKWITCQNKIVTAKGGITKFYEGGSGHTNSVFESHISLTVEKKLVRESSMESESLISILEKNQGAKWLHLDAEGIDCDLILSLQDRPELIPELVVYEHEAMSPNQQKSLALFFSKHGFQIFKGQSRNTIAIK